MRLKKFEQDLLLGTARLEITDICRANSAGAPSSSIYLALKGAKGGRAVLAIERDLVRHIVDIVLARPMGVAEKTLTSGEEGAFFFAIDKAGGDWLNLGGVPFTLAGMLVDGEQSTNFLTAPAAWSVGAELVLDSVSGKLRLLFATLPSDLHPSAVNCDVPFSMDAASDWPVSFRVKIGAARLGLDLLNNLGKGDLVIADSCSFPHGGALGGPVVLSCGKFTRQARWLDRTTLVLVEHDWENEMTDTRRTEIDVELELASQKEAAALELDVHIEIGKVTMRVDRALNLIPGAVVRLNKPIGTEVILRAGEKIIATGELVDHNGRLAVEITEIP